MSTAAAMRPGAIDGNELGRGVRIEVHGHIDLSLPVLNRLFLSEDFRTLVEAPGHFALLGEYSDGRIVMIASRSGIVPYFLTSEGVIPFAHGPNVATVVKNAHLAWRWDYQALADYLSIGHLLGSDTLHEQVRRLPPGAIVQRGIGGALKWQLVSSPPWLEAASSPEAAIKPLLQSMERLPSGECWLSISGGLDSRLLLAALLTTGRYPRLIVSGVPGSFDRNISSAIAKTFDLELTVVAVEEAAIVRTASAVAAATSGQLPLSHWAGLVHLAELPKVGAGSVLLGANGEAARGYYAPQIGWRDLRLATATPETALEVFARRWPSPFSEKEMPFVHPSLQTHLSPERLRARLSTALSQITSARTALDATDAFFVTQHARQKTGFDLAALAATGVDWRVPFMDGDWLRAVQALRRSWKLGSRLHRYAISCLCPRLLNFASELDGAITRKTPGLRYWLGCGRSPPVRHFLDQSIFRSAAVLRLLRDRRNLLAACRTDVWPFVGPASITPSLKRP